MPEEQQTSPLRAYVKSTWTHFKNNISGPIFGGFAILSLLIAPFIVDIATARSVRWTATITACLTVISLVIAQYQSYKDERRGRLLEREKNGRAEIVGEAFDFRRGRIAEVTDWGGERTGIEGEFTCTISLRNLRPVEVQIVSIAMDGSQLTPQVGFEAQKISLTTVKYGHVATMNLTFTATVDGGMFGLATRINLVNLKLTIQDALFIEHQIKVREYELLKFP
jgi:hypothetical protein